MRLFSMATYLLLTSSSTELSSTLPPTLARRELRSSAPGSTPGRFHSQGRSEPGHRSSKESIVRPLEAPWWTSDRSRALRTRDRVRWAEMSLLAAVLSPAFQAEYV